MGFVTPGQVNGKILLLTMLRVSLVVIQGSGPQELKVAVSNFVKSKIYPQASISYRERIPRGKMAMEVGGHGEIGCSPCQ